VQTASQMARLCPECAHWLYWYPNCKHDYVVGPGKRYCRKCGWDGSRSKHVIELIHGARADWVLVVPDESVADAKEKFLAWCMTNGIDAGSLDADDVRVDVGPRSPSGSFARYFIRRSALLARGIQVDETREE
jgi:hypothetical protein